MFAVTTNAFGLKVILTIFLQCQNIAEYGTAGITGKSGSVGGQGWKTTDPTKEASFCIILQVNVKASIG